AGLARALTHDRRVPVGGQLLAFGRGRRGRDEEAAEAGGGAVEGQGVAAGRGWQSLLEVDREVEQTEQAAAAGAGHRERGVGLAGAGGDGVTLDALRVQRAVRVEP